MTPASDRFDLLRRRLSCFLGDRRQGRRSVGDLAGKLGEFGEVAIVGGMLRDLLLGDAYGRFTSDVDLVVDAPLTPALHRLLQSHGAVENRFGGYALDTEWKADVWLLGHTWARVKGHRRVDAVDDLLGTTFFNWDAILYSLSRRQVVCGDDYILNLDDRLLDINLEPNPNRLGSCVRTLRSAVLWGAVVTPRLAHFALSVIREVGVAGVLLAEARSFRHRRTLTLQDIAAAVAAFEACVLSGTSSAPVRSARRGVQRSLDLPACEGQGQAPWHADRRVPTAGSAAVRRGRLKASSSASKHLMGHLVLG